MTRYSSNQLFDSDDIPALVVEAVLRSVWLVVVTVAGLVRMIVRAPAVLATVGTLVLLGGFGGWRAVGIAAAVLAVICTAWRMWRPSSFTRYVAPLLIHVWRVPLYRLWFPHVARRCGLVARDADWSRRGRRESEAARLLRVQVKGTGVERLLLRLPIGLTLEDVAHRAQAVGQAFGVAEARIVPDRPGRLWLELRRHDLLAATIPPIRGCTTDLDAVPVGRGDDGMPWRVRVAGTHTLIAGATGSGKGSVLWSLVAGLSAGIRDGSIQVWALDPKGGMELGLGAGCFARFEGGAPEAMCALLEDLVDVQTRRSMSLATHGLRRHEAHPGSPHIVVVIDELATLTAFAERGIVRRVEQALGLLLTKGRAVGISVVAAVQDPGKDVVAWRDLFPTRVALRLDNPIQVDMVLGDGARERGALADHISELTPGVGYVRVEGTRRIGRVRASYWTDADIRALCADLACDPTRPDREVAA